MIPITITAILTISVTRKSYMTVVLVIDAPRSNTDVNASVT